MRSCAVATIRMLGGAAHSHKVNFCKITNETRDGMEDSSKHSGQKFVCAVRGTAAGSGYELALSCAPSASSTCRPPGEGQPARLPLARPVLLRGLDQ